MTSKTKSLHSISFEGCNINTLLQYNTNTNHIGIGTTYRCRKEYQKDNKEKRAAQAKYYREANEEKFKSYRESIRDPNMSRMGSLELSIKRSCIGQGIQISDFTGFLTEQKYCKLFSKSFKELIRNRFHGICYLCPATEKDNSNRKLSVHHVNYDKSCLCQKTCEFVPLCQSCHAKTNHNRQTWEDIIMCYLFPERYFMVD